MLAIIGYLAAIIMGSTLGLLGAGGSILTLPILVYLLQVDPVTAGGYSLLCVGITALFGAYQYHRKKLIDYKITFLFSIPAIVAVYFTRTVLIHSIPDQITIFALFSLSKHSFIMILFALLMIISSYMMIRKTEKIIPIDKISTLKLTFIVSSEGLFVGIITGIVGAGGGFLIIPALVLFADLSMKSAVGSSLLIIALKSLIGFFGDIQSGIIINYNLIVLFLLCSITGMIIGHKLSDYFLSSNLKKVFGYFTLVLSIVIITIEI